MGNLHFLGLAAAALAVSPANAGTTALVGATAIDGTGTAIEDSVILVDDSKITCIGTAEDCKVPKKAEVVQLAGRYVTPGLVDAHVHFAQTGWMDGRPDGLNAPDIYPYPETMAALRADPGRWHRAYLCSGVTSVFDVGGADWTVTGEQASDSDRPDRARVRAAGPLITHASEYNENYVAGGHPELAPFLPFGTDDEVRSGIAHLKTIGSRAVKVWFLKPKPERREELEARLMLTGQLAREAGLPLIVHATGLDEAKAALRAGAAILVHSVDDKPVDTEFLDLLRANDTVYTPTIVVGEGWLRAMAAVGTGAAYELDDPGKCVDEAIIERINAPERLKPRAARLTPEWVVNRALSIGREQAIMTHNLRAVRDAGGRIALGTDAGNPLTLHGPSVNWELEAMQAAGMTPPEVIEAATIAGARAMGVDDETGSLTVGKSADLLVMPDDPRKDVAAFRMISHVMRQGTLYEQHELQVR
ncbi:amidohydrolase family protein [Croceicoccus sediminis]|uniref:amidohydrolase family protein n=1 Tax=Croceicoccus sediminis TaxID=2571150 RepID=UPI0011836FCA|nr:amidohydrolase family protein [Croceicoccus sediminis]